MKAINWKTAVLHGLAAGILSAAACLIYLKVYKEALGIKFFKNYQRRVLSQDHA